MQNPPSKLVYVVSASKKVFLKGSRLSTIDLIEKRQKYFHGIKGRWPPEPPEYFGFRYDGRLQSIHRVKSRRLFDNDGEKLYQYELGPAILPKKEVPTNDKNKNFPPIYRSAHCRCFLDLLLTCDSISEAFEKTKDKKSYKIWESSK